MSEPFKVRCQSVRADNGHFSMFFSHEEGLPSLLVWLPKTHAPYREGLTYRVTIELAPTNGE
jgi:hypothetical protein